MKTPYEKLLEAASPLSYRVINSQVPEIIGKRGVHIAFQSTVKSAAILPSERQAALKLLAHSANTLPKALEALKLAISGDFDCSDSGVTENTNSIRKQIKEAIRAIEKPEV